MRRFRWTVIVLALSFGYLHSSANGANSPLSAGSWIVNGGATFSSLGGDFYKNSKGDRSSLLLLYPSVGVFVAPSLNIGTQLLYAKISSGGDGVTVAGIGPRLTYYFDKKKNSTIKRSTYPYLTGSFIYGRLSSDHSDDHTTLTAFSFGGGITQMLVNSIGIYVELNYRSDKFKESNSDSVKGNSFNVFAGFTLFLWE